MNSTVPQPKANRCLAENGPKELESLFRAIVFHPSAPILIADDQRCYQEASMGASKLLGLSRQKIIGRSLDDFAVPVMKPVISERWRAFLEEAEQAGTLQLLGADGAPLDIEYTAKGNLLPVRHLLLLRDKTKPAEAGTDLCRNPFPSWLQDYALFLLDVDGRIAAWYAGAERIYGFKSSQTAGRHLTAVLKLSPFRGITFVTDLRERDRQEKIDEDVVEVQHNFEEIIGTSTAMKQVMRQVEVVAPTDATVLIFARMKKLGISGCDLSYNQFGDYES